MVLEAAWEGLEGDNREQVFKRFCESTQHLFFGRSSKWIARFIFPD
jgi:hypothetical protein